MPVPIAAVACPGCGLIQRIPPLQPGDTARCPRCSDALATGSGDTLERTLALSIGAAIVLVIANMAPIMGLSAAGLRASTTMSGVAVEMWRHGREITAAVVVFCAVIAPAAYIAFMLVALLSLRRSRAPGWMGRVMRGVGLMSPWSMPEVVMLAILVALIKIAALATASPGIGMYAMGVLVALLAAIKITFDPREVWKRVQWAR
jgi:paraquat-inducible protein A